MTTDRNPAPLDEGLIGPRSDLADVVRVLDEAKAETEENGWPSSARAHRSARSLLVRMIPLLTRRLCVYPLFDGEIAIEAVVASRGSVLLSCEPDGTVLCLVNIDRRSRHAKYETADPLPDEFLREALSELSELEAQIP